MIQQGTTNLETDIEWNAISLAFGPDGFRYTKRGVAQHALARTEAETLQADGWEGTVENTEGPNSVITATIATLDPDDPDTGLITRWGLDVQWGNVPARNSQKYLAYIAANGGNNGTTFRSIEAAVKQYETEELWTLYDALGTTQKAWAFDIVHGETVWEPDVVLRRHNSYPLNTGQTADWVDVNKVFTTAQIVALADPPAAIVGTLPTTYWLKTSASADHASDGRYEVVTHWIAGTVQRFPSHRYTYKV